VAAVLLPPLLPVLVFSPRVVICVVIDCFGAQFVVPGFVAVDLA